jgi:hypothetical protein
MSSQCPQICVPPGDPNSGIIGTNFACLGTTPNGTPYNAVKFYDPVSCPNGCCVVMQNRAMKLCKETPGCVAVMTTNPTPGGSNWQSYFGYTDPDGTMNPNAPFSKKAVLKLGPPCPIDFNPDWGVTYNCPG